MRWFNFNVWIVQIICSLQSTQPNIIQSIDFLDGKTFFNNTIIVLTLTSWLIDISCIVSCKKMVLFLKYIWTFSNSHNILISKWWIASISMKPTNLYNLNAIRYSIFLRSNKFKSNNPITTTCYTWRLSNYRIIAIPVPFYTIAGYSPTYIL